MRRRSEIIIAGIICAAGTIALFMFERTIIFEPVTTDGIVVEVVYAGEFCQGEHDFDEDEITTFLPELEKVVEGQKFLVMLTLYDAEFYHNFEGAQLTEHTERLPNNQVVAVDTTGVANFDEMTFYEAGRFTYIVRQEFDNEAGSHSGWSIDESEYLIVIDVTHDRENEVLVATVMAQDLVFKNYFTTDITVYLSVALDEERAAQLELARETRLREFYVDVNAYLSEVVGDQSNIGISFLCLATGHHFEYNGDVDFFSASTIKLPTHMLAAEAVNDGRITWDQRFIAREGEYLRGGDDAGVGVPTGLRNAMRNSIRWSSNVAHGVVARAIGHGGRDISLTNAIYARFMPDEPARGFMRLSPNHLTEILRELHSGRDNIPEYEVIIEYMRSTTWTNRFNTSFARDYVAHTPGWAFEYSHDSGIFFTEQPYILVVMTDALPNSIQFLSQTSNYILQLNLDLIRDLNEMEVLP